MQRHEPFGLARMGEPEKEEITYRAPTNEVRLISFQFSGHQIAFFVPPTGDRTPHVLPKPLSWSQAIESYLGMNWSPPYPALVGWTEDANAISAIMSRAWNPMGECWEANENYPTPDPITGAPRNPAGRTGTQGRGHLPLWGANPAVILVITTWSRRPDGQIVEQNGCKLLECVMQSTGNSPRQLPWVQNTQNFTHLKPFVIRL
ncbi:unnamed protein product [Protopolystoma xenopodis]|uniref:Uncharacterized protein n=1 Tax=Protopolystoma xenopodis TaxID=117903 RepID=A0A448W9P4_9PLAT|nr:unnamed protein product [Protopolystoma xenopodis]